jgi:Leucine-rich repeat (LRR) protein
LLAEVPSLNVRGPAIRTEGAVHLSRLPGTALLRHLNLGSHQIEHAGLKRLARARSVPRLRSLDLSGSRLWPDSLTELAAAGFAELRELVIGSPNLNDAASRLVGAAWLPSLRRLRLCKCSLLDGGTGRLVRDGNLASLTHLDLSDNRLGRGFIAALVDAPTFPALEELNLSYNPQLADAIPTLAEWPGLRRLRKLGLANVFLNRAGYDAIARSPHLDQLEVLDLRGSLSFAAAAQPLAQRFGDRLLH